MEDKRNRRNDAVTTDVGDMTVNFNFDSETVDVSTYNTSIRVDDNPKDTVDNILGEGGSFDAEKDAAHELSIDENFENAFEHDYTDAASSSDTDEFENAFGYEYEENSPNMKKKKKVKPFNLVLYIIAGILVSLGIVILFRESDWFAELTAKDETEGLITEEEIYPEAETYTPLATPVDKYDIIPVKFHFIDRGITCNVIPAGIAKDGSMETTPSAKNVTWLSVSPYVVPGDTGNAVLSGHNLWKGKAGTFAMLKKMTVGEKVAVTFDKGFSRYFEVVKKYECKYNDTRPMRTSGVDEPTLTLITCMGDWNPDLETSNHRVVVVCKPVSSK